MAEQKDAQENRIIVPEANETEGNGDSKRYSKGLKEISVFTEDMGDVGVDIGDAVTKGLRRFRKASNESAKKEKDGAIKELLPNLGKGLSSTLDAAKDIPTEIGEAFDTKTPRRVIKRLSKGVSSLFRGFGK